MGKLLERLRDASRSGVYRVRSDAAVLDALGQGGLAAARIPLKAYIPAAMSAVLFFVFALSFHEAREPDKHHA